MKYPNIIISNLKALKPYNPTYNPNIINKILINFDRKVWFLVGSVSC